MSVDGVIILHTARNAGSDNHSAGLSADFPFCDYLFMKMLHHHGGFFINGVTVPLHKVTQFLSGAFLVKHRIVFHCLHEFIETRNRRIVPQYVQNKPFLNRLLHGIDVERPVLDFAAVCIRNPECFQRLIFRRGGKGEIAGVGQKFPPLHHGVDFVLIVQIGVIGKRGKGKIHLRRVASALTGMRFIYHNGETMIFMFASDLREGKGEFFYRCNDHAFAVRDGLCQFSGALRPKDCTPNLRELFDSIADLPIQNTAVRYHNHGIQQRAIVFLQSDQLIRKPRNGIGFAASGAVLNQIPFSDAVFPYIGKQFFHHVKLMESRKYLLDRFLFCLRVRLLY